FSDLKTSHRAIRAEIVENCKHRECRSASVGRGRSGRVGVLGATVEEGRLQQGLGVLAFPPQVGDAGRVGSGDELGGHRGGGYGDTYTAPLTFEGQGGGGELVAEVVREVHGRQGEAAVIGWVHHALHARLATQRAPATIKTCIDKSRLPGLLKGEGTFPVFQKESRRERGLRSVARKIRKLAFLH
ncbi:hypothetical protein CEXT_41691, partial [Caerostris extrusa]